MKKGSVKIIGVDCAVQHQKVGVAIGTLDGEALELTHIIAPRSAAALVSALADELAGDGPVVLALDAPLGWPTSLGDGLMKHRAGEAHGESAHRMFRRVTDDVVCASLKKRSHDVGADRIARTAHAALQLLAAVRRLTNARIPLATSPGAPVGAVAIEVYPAATMVSRRWRATGYKSSGDEGIAVRKVLAKSLRGEVTFSSDLEPKLFATDHLFDAALCVLAGADFVRGDVIVPSADQQAAAEREGWIWVRPMPRS